MSTDQEIIEARLAAYVEGDLPANERAEIEKYLKANPQHAQLIKELQSHKGLVATLPRERAPAEVLDHLQQHLERSALLENVEEAAESMRIKRWPQWTAVAAMLLLAVGLGALVYQVLPSGTPTQVTLAPPSMQSLPSAPTLAGDSLREERKDMSLAEGTRAAESRGRDFVEQMADDMAKESATRQKRDQLTQELNPMQKGAQPTPIDGIPEGVPIPATPLAPAGRATMVSLNNGSAILVETDDALITQNLVAGFLAQNKIEYTTVPADDVKELNDAPATQPAEMVGAGMQIEAAGNQFANTFGQQQQQLGEVVSKLRTKEEVVAKKNKSQSDEAYLLARNVPADKAAEITKALAQQRGGKQQARYYTNADLYPEQQQQASQQQSIDNNLAPQLKPNSTDARPAEVQGNIGLAATQPTDLAAMLPSAAATPATTQPTTLPSGNESVVAADAPTTDLLIVVRSDTDTSAAATSTVESPAPTTTQPTTAPTTTPAAP